MHVLQPQKAYENPNVFSHIVNNVIPLLEIQLNHIKHVPHLSFKI